MRAEEFTQGRVMAKIESTGKIVEILRHADQVAFSDDTGWLLVNTNPDTKSHMGVKWIPDSTRFAWVKRFESLKENKFATGKQVLSYINQTHHEPMIPKLTQAVLAHPRWELKKVPLLNLNIPDEEYDDVEQEPESDPYNRIMAVDAGHAGEVSQHLIDKKPIVIDADRYIIDGNHRAWAAKYLLNRDYIDAWVPVEPIKEDQEEYLYHATYRPLLKSIQANGLGNTTQSQWTDSQPGVVYLARDPEVARSYAEAAESVPEEWLDDIVVLQILQADLDPKLLHVDRNVQDNTGDTLEYHAVIPAKLLRRTK